MTAEERLRSIIDAADASDRDDVQTRTLLVTALRKAVSTSRKDRDAQSGPAGTQLCVCRRSPGERDESAGADHHFDEADAQRLLIALEWCGSPSRADLRCLPRLRDICGRRF